MIYINQITLTIPENILLKHIKSVIIHINNNIYITNPIYRYEMLDSNINSDEEILSIAKEYKKKFLQENPEYKDEFLFYFCGYGDPTNTKILRF